MKIKVRPENTRYGIKIKNIRISNKLFVNNSLVTSCGTPALKSSDCIANNMPYTAFFLLIKNILILLFKYQILII